MSRLPHARAIRLSDGTFGSRPWIPGWARTSVARPAPILGVQSSNIPRASGGPGPAPSHEAMIPWLYPEARPDNWPRILEGREFRQPSREKLKKLANIMQVPGYVAPRPDRSKARTRALEAATGRHAVVEGTRRALRRAEGAAQAAAGEKNLEMWCLKRLEKSKSLAEWYGADNGVLLHPKSELEKCVGQFVVGCGLSGLERMGRVLVTDEGFAPLAGELKVDKKGKKGEIFAFTNPHLKSIHLELVPDTEWDNCRMSGEEAPPMGMIAFVSPKLEYSPTIDCRTAWGRRALLECIIRWGKEHAPATTPSLATASPSLACRPRPTTFRPSRGLVKLLSRALDQRGRKLKAAKTRSWKPSKSLLSQLVATAEGAV